MTGAPPPDLDRLSAAIGRRLDAAELLKRGARADSWRLAPGDGGPGLVYKRFHAADRFARAELNTYRLLEGTPGLAPPCLARDPIEGWLVLEEVAGAVDLFGLLSSGADAALSGLGRAMGRLIRVTERDAASLDPADLSVLRAEAAALAGGSAPLAEWTRLAGAPLDDGALAVLGRLHGAVSQPPRVAWTQGDPAPSNAIGDGRRVLLVDFEYAAWRHPLFDLAQWLVRCPLPRPWFETLAAAVRRELPEGAPLARSSRFAAELGDQVARAGLYMLGWLPAVAALRADRSWVGGWTVRDALCSTADRLASLGEFDPGLQPLGGWAAGLSDSLLERWPDQARVGERGALDWVGLVGSIGRGELGAGVEI